MARYLRKNKLEIQSYVRSLVRDWLSVLGLANAVVLFGGLAYVHFVIPERAAERAVDTATSRVSSFIASLDGTPKAIAEGAGKVEAYIAHLQGLLDDLPGKEMELRVALVRIEGALGRIESSDIYRNSEGIAAILESVDSEGVLSAYSRLEEKNGSFERRLSDLQQQIDSRVSVETNFRQKNGNDGTSNCDRFCAGRLWGGWTGTCVGAKLVAGPKSGEYVDCGNTPGRGNILTCMCSQLP